MLKVHTCFLLSVSSCELQQVSKFRYQQAVLRLALRNDIKKPDECSNACLYGAAAVVIKEVRVTCVFRVSVCVLREPSSRLS
jgi:hypothetical protein